MATASPLRNNRPQPGSVCICALPGKVEGKVEDGDALKLAQHAPSDDEGNVVEA
jgi:hypothetical protein